MGTILQTTGVAQGDILGPLLFIMVSGDFPSFLMELFRSVSVICCADDVVIIQHAQTGALFGVHLDFDKPIRIEQRYFSFSRLPSNGKNGDVPLRNYPPQFRSICLAPHRLNRAGCSR